MYYAIDAGHPAIPKLIEISESTADELKPMSCEKAADVARMLLDAVSGAPEASGFDVLALEHEDRDIHVLLRRRDDGMLANASYIEGEDLGDDIFSFAYLDYENRDRIIDRFNNWCWHHLDDEAATAYRGLIADMVMVQGNEKTRLAADVLMVAPTLSALESLVDVVRDQKLRSEIMKAATSIKAACSPR